MKHITRFFTLFLVAAVSLAACKKESFFSQDTSRVSVDCTAQSVKHTVTSSVAWSSDCSEVSDWISLEPGNGPGGSAAQEYTINIKQNDGPLREGVFYLVADGVRHYVIVSQAPYDFKFGEVTAEGKFVAGQAGSAVINIPYSGSNGTEKYKFTVALSGDASTGLKAEEKECVLERGDNVISLSVSGTPEKSGKFTATVSANAKALATVELTVSKPAGTETEPATWAFCKVKGGSSDVDALALRHPEWNSTHIVSSDSGEAVISIVEATGKTLPAVNNWAYNDGHIYMKGLYVNDFLQIRYPVANVPSGKAVNVKGSFGGSGSSAGYFLAEYSFDGSVWKEVPGAKSEKIGDITVKYHAAPMDSYVEKDGAFQISFPVASMEEGTVYVRFRVSADVRLNHSSTVPIATGGGGSTRLKGDWSISIDDAK